jgi:glycosyltransferase involved in cell wall biosynthesis
MNQDVSRTEVAPRRVSLVTTVLQDPRACAVLLDSLEAQTRMPDEIIVVDGGSTDDTPNVVLRASERNPCIRLISAPGANIGQGRNIGIASATGEIIVSSDSGCRLDPHWVDRIVAPFEQDADTELVAGFYKIDPHSLIEAVVGTATMRGALDPVDPETFNPSCRSMAFTKALWERAGRFPEWIDIDDTLFNIKLRRMTVNRRFAGDAVAYWRPRSTLRGIYRQFRFYAIGHGHTQLGVAGPRYNLRNLALCLALAVSGLFNWGAWILLGLAVAYFYLYSFHRKSRRVAAKLGTWRAYPLCILVHWVIILANLDGYLRATYQRWRDRERYQGRLEAYLAGS